MSRNASSVCGRCCCQKDCVLFFLAGEFACRSLGRLGNALLDVVHRRWSFEMMDGLGLEGDILPAVYESSDVTGTISVSAAEFTDLAAGISVAGGGLPRGAHVMGVTQIVGRSSHCARRIARPVLAVLPDGRTHAASRCPGSRRLDRVDGKAHSRRPDPVCDRRRFLQPEGLLEYRRGVGH
jgi:hypothetical protein